MVTKPSVGTPQHNQKDQNKPSLLQDKLCYYLNVNSVFQLLLPPGLWLGVIKFGDRCLAAALLFPQTSIDLASIILQNYDRFDDYQCDFAVIYRRCVDQYNINAVD